MSTIAAGTTSGTALVSTGNTTGTLVFQTNGTTTALTLGTDQSATFVGAVTAPSFSGTSSTATNLAGGSNGTIPYQSAAGTTQMLAVGSVGQLLQTNGVGAPSWATVTAGFTLGTPVATTSGTSIDFTGIPAGVKQIVVTFSGVSMNSSNWGILVQFGDAGGIENTGYASVVAKIVTSASPTTQSDTTGFLVTGGGVIASNAMSGSLTFTLENSSVFRWTLSGALIPGNEDNIYISSGRKALSQELSSIRITSNDPPSYSFDAGEINIAYI
jgi:hypothetical protein